jgi:hypothetical protein
MEETELVLDGNALAGVLREIFALDVTAFASECAACRAREPVAALKAYVRAPGLVLRCRHCEAVILRMARANGRMWLDARGLRYLELREEPPP